MDREKLTGQLKTLNVWTLRNFKRISKTLISIYWLHLERKTATTTLIAWALSYKTSRSHSCWKIERNTYNECRVSKIQSRDSLTLLLLFLRMLVYIFLKRFWVDSYGIQLKNEKKNSECIFLEICKNSRNSLKKLYFSMHWWFSDMMFITINTV